MHKGRRSGRPRKNEVGQGRRGGRRRVRRGIGLVLGKDTLGRRKMIWKKVSACGIGVEWMMMFSLRVYHVRSTVPGVLDLYSPSVRTCSESLLDFGVYV
jgi:hypothetical protein